MRKPEPFRIAIAALVVFLFAVFSVQAGLLDLSLDRLTLQELRTMAAAYGLSSAGSAESLRERITDFLTAGYGGDIDAPVGTRDTDSGEGSYTLEIENALSITSSGSLVILEGEVQLRFSVSDDGWELTADRVIIDSSAGILTAMGTVKFTDSAGSREIDGDVVCYDWNASDIRLSGGTIVAQRTNSENETVQFYATGETITYLGGADIVALDGGSIATSPTDPYWSIRTEKTVLLDDGDMFLVGARLNLGRVPVLWLPAFFYSGARLSFNPAIGLASDRGMFLNTTTEIYGVYPLSGLSAGASSFATLLRSSETGEFIRDGILYRSVDPGEDLGETETWARSTGSYMAVLADVYQYGGLHLGLVTVNSFNKGAEKLDLQASLGRDWTDTTYGLRFFEELQASVSTDRLSVSLKLPFYTDPYVRQLYSNRLDTFSLDALFGSEQEFPDTFKTVNSYIWDLNLKADLTPKTLKPWINSLKINSLEAKVNWKYSSSEKRFTIDSATLPSMSVAVSGKLLNLSVKHSTSKVDRTDYTDPYARSLLERRDALSPEGEADKMPDGLKLYSGTEPETVSSRSYNNTLNLGYSWTQTLSDTADDGDFSKAVLNYGSDGTLTLSSNLGDRLFTLSESLAPSFRLTKTAGEEPTDNGKLVSKLQVSVPLIGLTYNLNWKVLSFNRTGGELASESFKWDSANVSSHRLSLSLPAGRFTFSAVQTLKPTRQTLTPQVRYSDQALTASVSQVFAENPDGGLQATKLSAQAALKLGAFNAGASGTYDFSKSALGWDSFVFSQNASYRFGTDGPVLSQNLSMKKQFELGNLGLKLGWKQSYLSFNWEGYDVGSGRAVRLATMKAVASVPSLEFSFWKGRIAARADLNLSLDYDFRNRYASSLSASVNLVFCIAEFLDFSLKVSTSNSSFYRYFDDGGSFSPTLVVQDLLRSFDFVGGGRYDTGFNLSGLSAELTHYMKDWDFHCQYNAGVVLSEGSWVWKQTASFYIKWNAIPDLLVERTEEWSD